MASRSLVAVIFGFSVGIVTAFAFRERPPEDTPPLRPAAARPIEGSAPASTPPPAAPERPALVPASAAPASAAAPAISAPSVPTPTDVEAAITSKDEFQAAAVACDEKDAGACRRAARAVELGEVVPKDLARAKTFRRVELTVLVRGCEKNSVEACLTLADRYLRGEGVAPSERTAAALIDHARESCERHPEDACRNVPKN
jgi:hypothetical protein